MRLIIAGCEYSGTSTLANAIASWVEENLGRRPGIHDHFKGPPEKGLSAEDEARFSALTPRIHEMFQRYQIEYHLQPGFFAPSHDHIMVGMHLEDAVYAPLYYSFGGPGEYGERTVFARHVEERLLGLAPDIIEVLVTASAEVIRQRLTDAPHRNQIIRDADVEHVLQRFDDEHKASRVRNKMEIDTSDLGVDECLAQFLTVYKGLMTDADQLRVLSARARKAGDWI